LLGVIQINLIGQLDYDVRLFNVEGRLLIQETNVKFVDVKDLNIGTYIIELIDLNSGDTVHERI